MAKGYFKREDLTAERFIEVDLGDGQLRRLYRTGDLAQVINQDYIGFVGRADEQIKIRGHRIELGEVEQQLMALPGIDACVVMAKDFGSVGQQLVGYVEMAETMGLPEVEVFNHIREGLSRTLPDYMVPMGFMLIDVWPLTPSGKVDKMALPVPDMTGSTEAYVEASSDIERTLVVIWSELLNIPADKLSITANFFDLGGHSLLTVRLVAQIRLKMYYEVPIKDVFEFSTIELMAKFIVTTAEKIEEQHSRKVIEGVPREAKMALSFAQQRLWFIDQLEDGSSGLYNMPLFLWAKGHFDLNIANAVLQYIVQRHEILRTVYQLSEGEGEPKQVIVDQVESAVKVIDLSELKAEERDERVYEISSKEAVAPFDLSADVMVRVTWLALNEGRGALLFNVHHIASDAWSMAILVREFVQVYAAFSANQDSPLAPLPIQYVDFALWQRDYLRNEVLETQLDYWAKQLGGVPTVHSLPLDRARPKINLYQGAYVKSELDADMGKRFNEVARLNNVTEFMLLHTMMTLVIARNSNMTDVVFGTPVANRTDATMEPLMGVFINTLVLRTDTANCDTFAELLERVKQVNLDAQTHQEIPFEQLVDSLNVERSTVHSPLFQIMLNMNTNETQDLSLPGLSFERFHTDMVQVKFDIQMDATISDKGISLQWAYDTCLFNQSSIERFNRCLVQLLTSVLEEPAIKLADLQMLTADEKHYLINALNDTAWPYPQGLCIHDLFMAQVTKTPDALAVICGEQSVTYRALDENTNRLANYLLAQGVTVGTRVGIVIDRSIEMLTAVMATLKAGGCYVPLDPAYPASRIDYMLKDSGVKVLLSNRLLASRFADSDHTCLALDDMTPLLHQYESHFNIGQVISDDNLAYLIYTSGSTGFPKGVMIEHRATVALIHWAQRYFDRDELQSVLASTSLSFDLSVFEMFVPLSVGGKVVVVNNILSLLEPQASYQDLTLINTVPSGIDAVLEHVPESVRTINLAGESLPQALVNKLHDNYQLKRVVNLYGPSEDTTYSTVSAFDGPVATQPSIGHPIDNTRAYVLDNHGQPVPSGCIGELYLAGQGLARGYLNQPQMSAAHFVANPFDSGERMYKTGDLVRYGVDGQLQYIGRIDDQVKIRGFRIEPKEIEAQISQVGGVKSALVMTFEDQLVGYFIPSVEIAAESSADEGALVGQIKASLNKTLPEYMVLQNYVMLDQWPLTPNGKIDKQALPDPDGLTGQAVYIAPATATEKALVSIWAALLKRDADSLGINANFFELGGHSLLSIRLVAQIRATLNKEVALKFLFEYPTIAPLSAHIDSSVSAVRPAVTVVERSDAMPLSFAQQRLWFIDQFEQGNNAAYNMPVALRVSGQFDVAIARRALSVVIERHEVLRTVYRSTDDEPVQVIIDKPAVVFETRQVSEAQVSEVVLKDASTPFDLSQDLMVRASWLTLSDQAGVLLFNMHHIASDGWSMGILVNEFGRLYQAFSQGLDNPLAPLAIGYVDYALWQRDYLKGEVLAQQLNYWRKQLDEAPVVHSLGLDYPRPEVNSHIGARVSGQLSPLVAGRLNEVARSHNLTPFMLIHAMLTQVLSRHSNSTDIVIGTPVANRMDTAVESLIGFFVNTLVLRVDTATADHFGHVRQVNLDAQAHQDIPFEQLVEHLNIPRSARHAPLFQIMLSMNTTTQQPLSVEGLQFSELESGVYQAKFDLLLDVAHSDTGIYLNWTYDTGIFEATTIERLNDHLARMLEGVLTSDTGVAQWPMLSDDETRDLLEGLNPAPVDYPATGLLPQLFEAAAQRTPDKVALSVSGQRVSFGQLNARTNQLAHYLRGRGVSKDSLVGLALTRSVETVVGILAILKAGGAYLPMDVGHPDERLRFIISDSQIALLFTSEDLLARFESIVGSSRVECLPLTPLELSEFDARTAPAIEADAHSLAYVIYTSGSSGQPKGVLVEHAGLLNLGYAMQTLEAGKDKPWGWSATYAFDASIQALGQLALGQPVVLLSDEEKQDIGQLRQRIEQDNIGVLDGTPSLVALWFELGGGEFLPDLVIGGEAISAELWQTLVQHQQGGGRKVWNVYGPTECTVNSSWTRVEGDGPHIGRMLPNTSGYILDNHEQLVPKGCVGELYIGGGGLARGYLNRAELMAERFVSHPFAEGERLYRTGDLVRYRADGQLAYVGRNDDQVKLRGFRIELGEVVQQLLALASVESTLVMVKQQQLVAYVKTVNSDDDIDGFGAALTAVLPDHMVPARFIAVAQWPLTPNGKIDKKALPDPDGLTGQAVYIAPVTATEKALVSIWAALLKRDADTLGINANFFELGGHSLLSIRLVAQIRVTLNKEVALKFLFEYPTIAQLSAHIDSSVSAVRPAVTVVERSDTMPLSFAQQRLWFIDQFEQGNNAAYNMPAALRVSGQFDVAIARRALSVIIERHEVLRTVYRSTDDEPVQVIIDKPAVVFETRQVSEAQIGELVLKDASTPFDLSQDLMVRASWLTLSDQAGVLLFNMHHIASDGWSMGILVNEFGRLYQAFSQGLDNPLAPLAIGYVDYTLWQRDYLKGEVLAQQLDYWRKQLDEAPVVHSLGLDYPRSEVNPHIGERVSGQLSPQVAGRLNEVARSHNLTPFMLIHAVLTQVLSRHSNSTDIVIGTPVANRMDTAVEPLIGFFVNTLVLRVDTATADHFAHVRQVNLDAQAHQDIPFEQLVEHLNIPRSARHAPLFQIMLSMNTTQQQPLSVEGLQLSELESGVYQAKFDLLLDVAHSDTGIYLNWTYDSGIFEVTTIEQLNDHLERMLEGVLTSGTWVAQLPMLSDDETRDLLEELNPTPVDHPMKGLLSHLFEAAVQQTPDKVAVTALGQRVSFAELNARTNQLAHYLRGRGVGKDTLVGLAFARSVGTVVGILAILKAGGAYVPMDVGHPDERLHFIINDSQIALLLTSEDLMGRFESIVGSATVQCLALEQLEVQELGEFDAQSAPVIEADVHSLAYVIYTSGSTGHPKGVLVEHVSVLNQSYLMQTLGAGKDRAWGWSSTYAFDASLQALGQLVLGQSVVLLSDEEKQDIGLLRQRIEQDDIGVIDGTPSLVALWFELGGGEFLPDLVLGGETVSAELWQTLVQHQQAGGHKVWNVYGPTECTVSVTCARVLGDDSHIGPIWPNVRGYILDSHRQLVPKGCVGELYISGGGALSRGYLNRAELMTERFVTDPFVQGERMYRTGDLVRYREDGCLAYIGRNDEQVKIRGYRIELGEIEQKLLTLDSVASALVMVKAQQLVAYVKTVNSDEDIDGFGAALAAVLPDYMVPARFMAVAQWPLTPNGKIDKKALPDPDGLTGQAVYIAPGTDTEKALVSIWAELLGVDEDRLGITADFFTLGGHSLLSIRLIAMINNQFGTSLVIRDVFVASVFKDMAQLIAQSTQPLAGKQLLPRLKQWLPILSMATATPEAPTLYVIPGAGVIGAAIHPLAQALSDKLSVKLLDNRGLYMSYPMYVDMAEQVNEFVNSVVQEQPEGVINLAGHSFGGSLIIAMALLLEQRGRQVQLVLLDSLVQLPDEIADETNNHRLVYMQMIWQWIYAEQAPSMDEQALYPNLRARLVRDGFIGEQDADENLQRFIEVYVQQVDWFDHYRIQSQVDAPVLLLHASNGAFDERKAQRLATVQRACRQLLSVIEVDGDHHSILTEPNCQALVSHIDRFVNPTTE